MKNFFTRYKNPASLVIALIIISGLLVYGRMQTALFPEITFPKIKIIADAGQQPIDKMMISVTKPLENAIKRVPNLNKIRSTTGRGSCEISAFMNWDANIDLSMQQIESKINEVKNQLPQDVDITVEKMNPSILQIMGFSLESNSKSPIELRMLANYTIKPFLSQVQGVAQVMISGGKQKEYWVVLDRRKMAGLSVTPDNINTALGQTNFIKSNGYIADFRYLYLTVTDARVQALDDIGKIVLRNNGKRIVHLDDIAEIEIHDAAEYVKINANGKDALLVGIMKQPNSNLIQVTNDINVKIKELQKILPRGVSLKPYYVQADFVNSVISGVSDCVWIGLGLSILVAILFLRSLRASAVILFTIPVTLCLSLTVIYLVGYTFNIMTLGALAAAIGLITDDAIVVMEQIHRTQEEQPEEPAGRLVQKAVSYLFPAMLGSSLSTIVIFLPFVLMTDVAGAYFKVLSFTMIITLVCSFFVTWLGLPVIYLLFSRKKSGAKHTKAVPVKVPRQNWLHFAIRYPIVGIIIFLMLIGAGWYAVPKLQTGFLPEMDEGSIVLDYSSPPGTSLEETDRMLREAEKIIAATPEVQAYSRRTGTQLGFFITEPNRGDYLIQLKKKREKSTEEVISSLRKQIAGSQPALRIDFGQVIGDMLGDLMTSVQPIEVKIFGDNPKRLQAVAKEVAETVSGIKGTADVFNGIVIAGPSVNVVPNYAALALAGITPTDLQYQVQNYVEGNIVGTVQEKEQLTNIRTVYPGNRRVSAEELRDIQLFLPSGHLVPFHSLASVTLDSGDAEIQRENLQSIAAVTGRLENRDLGSVMTDVKKAVLANIALPQGYHIEFGGSYQSQQKSFKELLLILAFAALLVFCVIVFLFRDFGAAFMILVLSVVGISGSYVALLITHTALNVGSYTGIIMIVGIIGENAIFTFLQFKEALLGSDAESAIIYSISTRLRPKLMTAIGAITALMPLALGIGAGAQLHQPLAIAVIGGFFSALPLLLIVLPTWLKMVYSGKGRLPANALQTTLPKADNTIEMT
jgi:CzcA family heavy metal efflux pump